MNEHDLECEYNKWYVETYPYDISCYTPYAYMHPGTYRKVKMAGYQPGYPDRFEPDPRILIQWEGNILKIRVFHGKFDECKNPNKRGRVSKDQKLVLASLHNRGYCTFIMDDLEVGKETTKAYKKSIPLYNGWIEIDTKDKIVNLPKCPEVIELPGRFYDSDGTVMIVPAIPKGKKKVAKRKRKRKTKSKYGGGKKRRRKKGVVSTVKKRKRRKRKR